MEKIIAALTMLVSLLRRIADREGLPFLLAVLDELEDQVNNLAHTESKKDIDLHNLKEEIKYLKADRDERLKRLADSLAEAVKRTNTTHGTCVRPVDYYEKKIQCMP